MTTSLPQARFAAFAGAVNPLYEAHPAHALRTLPWPGNPGHGVV
ncbi:MAG: hypothetical protein WBN85_08680 [Candidatus Macondimonas sp.]